MRHSLLLSMVILCLAGPVPALAAGETGARKAGEAAQAQLQGNLEQSLTLYGEALDDATLANDRKAAIYNDRGVVLARLGQPKAALEDFNRSVQLLPEAPSAYNNRGNTLLGLGLPGEAIKDFDRAILLAPGYAAAYGNRASAYLQLKQAAAAEQDYTHAIQLMPGSGAPALIGRGRAWLLDGRPQAAIRDFGRALVIDPRFALGYKSRAEAKLQTELYAEAVEDLSRAAAFEPGNADIYVLRGQAYLAVRNAAAAIKDFGSAVETAPSNATAYAWRALAQIKVEAFDEAEADLTRALEIDPRSALAYAVRGLSLAKSEQPDLAMRDLEKGLKIEPDAPELIWIRGEIQEVQGKTSEAIADYRTALAAKPWLRDAADGLERLGVAQSAAVDVDAVRLGSDEWRIVKRGRLFFATSSAVQRLLIPLETVGDVAPRLLEWDEKKGPFRGFAVLRYWAGQSAGAGGAEDVEQAVLVDQAGPSVLAVLPQRQGSKVATWTWDDGKVTVASVDGYTDELQLRPSRGGGQTVAARRDDMRRYDTGWLPWDGQSPQSSQAPPPARREAARPRKSKNLFELLFGN